jgi:hypothetical protein
MTAVNIAVDPGMAVVVTDTLLAGGPTPRYSTKVVSIPHARMAVAGAGASGFTSQARVAVLSGLLGDTLAEFVELAPTYLRSIWRAGDWRYPSAIYVVGGTGRATVAAYELTHCEDFEPRQLMPGVYFAPPPGARRADPGPLLPAPSRDSVPDAMPLVSAPVALQPWAERLQAIVAAVPRQQRDGLVPIGGHIVRTFVTAEFIEQRILSTLPELPTP